MNALAPRPAPTDTRPVVRLDRDCRVLRLRDDLGGEALVDMARPVPLVIDWHAVPDAKRYGPEEDTLKRRGFARTVLGALAQLGVTQFGIPLQSLDTQKAMARLRETGVVTPVPDFVAGPSDAEHPTRFTLHPDQCRVVRLVVSDPDQVDAALLGGLARLAPPACAAPGLAAPDLD